jgi:general secretion pathway protein G
MKTALKKGFTLIELLVVISIIGILATLITANLNAARSRARDSVRKADLKNLQTALRLYYNDKGKYPTASEIPWDGPWTSGSTTYMNLVPDDPLPNQHYAYTYDVSSDTYVLQACLENESDPKCDEDVGGGEGSITCTGGCSYTVKP